MTETPIAHDYIADALKASGLRGSGSVWRLTGPEIQWVVHIDRLPVGRRLGVDIGLDLQVEAVPRRPTDCPILTHLENLPPVKDLPVSMAMDLGSRLDPDERRRIIETAVHALGRYLSEHMTLADIREAYRTGDLGSAFIHNSARAVLEAKG